MEYAAALSGAALGFIYNDVRGAYYGQRLGRYVGRFKTGEKVGGYLAKLKKSMAPIPRTPRSVSRGRPTKRRKCAPRMVSGSRSRGRSVSRSKSRPRSRSSSHRSDLFSRSRSRSVGPSRTNIVNYQPTGSRQVVATRNRQVKKNKRHMKVSVKFAKKVRTVLENNLVKGVYTNKIYTGAAVPTNDRQAVILVGGDVFQAAMFNPTRVLAAASVLWKQAVASKYMTYTGGNDEFNAQSTVVNVLNSYCKFGFKNNSRRTFDIEIYNCIARDNRAMNPATEPVAVWGRALATDTTAGIAKPGANGGATVSAPSIELFGASPGQTSTFAKEFHYTSRTISLDPGQVFSHSVQGPKHVKYDFSKFQETTAGNGFFDVQKGLTQFCMIVLKPDLVIATDYVVGHLRAPPLEGELLAIEREDHFVLGMPEQAGFDKFVVGPTYMELNKRHKAYCHNVWQVAGATAPVKRVDELNPYLGQSFN